MKKEIEEFFNMPFEQALNEKNEFTLMDVSQRIGINLQAMVYFNLAKQGWSDASKGYSEAKKDELDYLEGTW